MNLENTFHRVGITFWIIRSINTISIGFGRIVRRDGIPGILQGGRTVDRRYTGIDPFQAYGRNRSTEITVLSRIFLDEQTCGHELPKVFVRSLSVFIFIWRTYR